MANRNICDFNDPVVVANGGTGVASNSVPYGVICAGTTSTAALQNVAALGSSGQVLTSNGAGALPTFQNSATSGTITTQVTTSGTDYTISVPVTSKLIIITLIGLSGSGTDKLLLQLGTAGGIETTGYIGTTGNFLTSTNWSNGMIICDTTAASDLFDGTFTLTLADSVNNTWGGSTNVHEETGAANQFSFGDGYKTLPGPITQIKMLWSGVDTFDAGKFGVLVYQ